jgi:isoquinoline 1-oxidoreductase subunit beta
MTAITDVSRRDLFKGAAAASRLVLGFHLGLRELSFAEAGETPNFAPNAFLSIDETSLVTIVASRSEMGTGIKTDLPLVLAGELEADWKQVKVIQAQGDPKYGDQNTDGSRSTWQFFGPMLAGATTRQMLETAAAQTWNVSVGECGAQSNYTDYLVPRIDITPETHVSFVQKTHFPGGVGEPGVPPTAPAICNAIYAATGKRIRTLPVDPQQLKAYN